MKTTFICPFNLDRLTGTPIRAQVVMKSVAQFSNVSAVAAEGLPFNDRIELYNIGSGNLGHFTKNTLKKLRELNPDIVHSFTTVAIAPALLYKILHNRKAKVIFEMHGWGWFETKGEISLPKRVIFFTIDLLGLFFSNVIIAMSNTQKHFLQNRFGKFKQIEVIWGPVDFPITFQSPVQKDFISFGYLGNSSWWQGIHIIIGAAKILEESHPNIRFILAGFDFSDHEKYPKMKNVTYVGKIKRGGVVEFIKNCDAMLSPRVKEDVSDLQYPQKLSEYLSAGRPVIASDTSDQRVIIERAGCGLILDNQSGEALALAIAKMADLSTEARSGMGRRAIEFAKNHFSFEVFTKNLKNLYSTIR